MQLIPYYLVRFLLWCYFILYHRMKVRGTEHIPRHGALILASNHVSFLDPPLVGVASPRVVDFMAREDLFHPLWFGRALRACRIFPVRREEQDFRAMREAIRRLRQGRVIGMFPEGTRSPDGTLQESKLGVGLLAIWEKVPVVPVCVKGTKRAFGRSHRWIKPYRVSVEFGEPIYPESLVLTGPRKKRYHMLSQEIMKRIAELKTRQRSW